MIETTNVRSEELSVVLDKIKDDVNGYSNSKVAVKEDKLEAVRKAIQKVEQALARQAAS